MGTRVRPLERQESKISARDARQRGMQFYTDYGAKGIIGSEQHGAAHASAEIDEGIFIDGLERSAAAPAHDEALKNRRSNGVIGRYVAVVSVPRAEMTSGDKAACSHSKFEVEWMADQAVFFSQAGQAAPARNDFLLFPFA